MWEGGGGGGSFDFPLLSRNKGRGLGDRKPVKPSSNKAVLVLHGCFMCCMLL